jgi:hypothetical protein
MVPPRVPGSQTEEGEDESEGGGETEASELCESHGPRGWANRERTVCPIGNTANGTRPEVDARCLASAAGPGPADLTFTTDSATTLPGGTVNLSMTITNNRTYDVWFVHQTIEPTWLTTQRADLEYSFTGCSLDGAAAARAVLPPRLRRTRGARAARRPHRPRTRCGGVRAGDGRTSPSLGTVDARSGRYGIVKPI